MRTAYAKSSWSLPVGIALIAALMLGCVAYADIGTNNAIDRIVLLYRDNAHSWESSLRGYAISLFWILAGVEFTWTAIRLVLKGADFTEFLAELVNRILYIGFFLMLLLHSSEWSGAIVQSFRTAADAASGAVGVENGISPANVLETGLNIVTAIWDSLFKMNPMDGLAMVLAAIVILICFALMAASLIEALIESYIVISAGVLFMGFGGSSWTSDYAKKILVYAVSVGAKLFMLQLIIGLGERLIREMASEFNSNNLEDILIMLGVSVVFFVITRNIPQMVQGLINGTSFGHAGTLSSAISAGVAAGVATIAGSGYTAVGAAKLASEQLKTSDAAGTAPESKLARAANWTGSAVKNLGKASIDDIGGRLSGRPSYGTMGGRMGRTMHQKAKDMAADRQKPKEPATQENSSKPANTIRPL